MIGVNPTKWDDGDANRHPAMDHRGGCKHAYLCWRGGRTSARAKTRRYSDFSTCRYPAQSLDPGGSPTASVVIPFTSIYNNLVLYEQHTPRNTMDSIVPELATGWTWSEDRTP